MRENQANPMHGITMDEFRAMRGKPVYSAEEEKIGEVKDIFYDTGTDVPEWLKVETKSGMLESLFGGKEVLVPIQQASMAGDGSSLRVPYSKEQVKSAPEVEVDEISEEMEETLYSHYGLSRSEHRYETDVRTEEEHPVTPPMGDESTHDRPHRRNTNGEVSVSRSEEELRVGKRQQETTGKVRVRKWVETEPATEEVEVRRQTAKIERQPVDRPASESTIGQEEEEIVLHEERPVVGKETVERERITVSPQEEAHTEVVHGEVRKEHVEVIEEDEEDVR